MPSPLKLKENKVDNETILKSIERNKPVQDSVAQLGEQIKKVIEGHKEKQKGK